MLISVNAMKRMPFWLTSASVSFLGTARAFGPAIDRPAVSKPSVS